MSYSREENRRLIDEYLVYIAKVQGYSEKTVISYSHDLKRLEDFLEEHKLNLEDFVFEDAKSFSLGLYEQQLKPASINRVLSSNRSFFHNLCENGVLKTQPFTRVKRAKQGRRIPTVLSEDEIDMLLNCEYDDYTSLMEITMFNMFYSTGCRLSEVIDMNIRDIDMGNRRIIVTGKGTKQRYVFITERAAGLLNVYLPEREKILKICNRESDILFVNKKGNKLPVSSVHSIFDKYRVKLGITKKFTPHVFRHSFATHLLDNDSDIRIVQALLGHESIGTTQVYTHVTSKRLENVYRKAHPHAEDDKEHK